MFLQRVISMITSGSPDFLPVLSEMHTRDDEHVCGLIASHIDGRSAGQSRNSTIIR